MDSLIACRCFTQLAEIFGLLTETNNMYLFIIYNNKKSGVDIEKFDSKLKSFNFDLNCIFITNRV